MMVHNHKIFAKEAFKITVLSLIIIFLFKLFHQTDYTILIALGIVVLGSAAIHQPKRKLIQEIVLSFSLMTVTTIIFGVTAYYYPLLTSFLMIIYVTLVFSIIFHKPYAPIFILSLVTAITFSNRPFSLNTGLHYLVAGIVASGIAIIFFYFFNLHDFPTYEAASPNAGKINATRRSKIGIPIVAASSYTIAILLDHFIKAHFNVYNTYWVELTALLVIQGSYTQTLATAKKRMFINFIGAFVAAYLFNYLLSKDNFWLNFLTLLTIQYLIFYLSFSYVARTFMIEIYVLGMNYLLGQFQTLLAIDRALFTILGGVIVIVVCVITSRALNILKVHN